MDKGGTTRKCGPRCPKKGDGSGRPEVVYGTDQICSPRELRVAIILRQSEVKSWRQKSAHLSTSGTPPGLRLAGCVGGEVLHFHWRSILQKFLIGLTKIGEPHGVPYGPLATLRRSASSIASNFCCSACRSETGSCALLVWSLVVFSDFGR